MADRLVLRFVSRCQTVDQFARVFCQHAQPDRLSVPLATEPPPVGTRLRAAVALANKLGVIEGDAEIVEFGAGAVQLRFTALDPRSRGFLSHLVAHRSHDPAPVPRHLVPMGAAVGGPTSADPSLGTCLIEAIGGGAPMPAPVDINATTRTSAVPPVASRQVPPVEPRALAARGARREAATLTGVSAMPAPTPPGVRPPGRAPAVPAPVDDGLTQPLPGRRVRNADSRPIDDLATDIVPALHDTRADDDPTIDPPPPAPLAPMAPPRPMASPPAGHPSAPPMAPPMAPMAHPAPGAHLGAHPGAHPGGHQGAHAGAHPQAHPPAPPAPYASPPGGHLAAPLVASYPAAPPMAPAPTPMAAAVALSPANVGSAVAGPAAASSWPMPAPPPGWSPPAAPPRAPGPGGYPTAQLPALGYDGGGARPGTPRDRRRPVEMEGDPDLTEIVTVPRRVVTRRRWPVIAVTSLIVVVIVVIAIIAASSGGDEAGTRPTPAPTGTTTDPAAPAASTPPSAPTPPAAPAAGAAVRPTPPAPPPAPAAASAPAAAPPPSGPCSIAFSSSPAGAEVLVDGKSLGTTPFTAEVPCVELTAVVKRDRYRTERVTVEPRPGEQAVKVRLDRPTFKVEIVSRPLGALVTVGGTAAGKTPVTVSVPGHENVIVEVTRPGYAPQSQKVYATRTGQRVEIALRKRR